MTCKSAARDSRKDRGLAAVGCSALSVHSNWVNVDQAACKPGSVHRLATDGRPFLWDGPRGPPHATNPDGARRRACPFRGAHPYSVLLQAGLALPSLSPGTRCALTAPFHPYRGTSPEAVCFLWRYPSGYASLRLLPRADVIRRLAYVEPGLSSSSCLPAIARPPDRARLITPLCKLGDSTPCCGQNAPIQQ
jgi:hypothetical protein